MKLSIVNSTSHHDEDDAIIFNCIIVDIIIQSNRSCITFPSGERSHAFALPK
jgi:hypothetical protein